MIIEDVAFPVEHLADAALGLTALFHKHGYHEATVFGHAKDGNLHFVIAQAFDTRRRWTSTAPSSTTWWSWWWSATTARSRPSTARGGNMAPFVEAEWGPEAQAVMNRLKALADPRNLLNPDVILNADPSAHLAHLKVLPPVEEEVDKCIECGWCESRCPSRDLTLSPRQRIVVRREIARLGLTGEDPALRRSLEKAFAYMGMDTCATDGLCALACPVAIDTGALIKRLRREAHAPWAQAAALAVARHLGGVEPLVRLGLRSGRVLQGLLRRTGHGGPDPVAGAAPVAPGHAPGRPGPCRRPAVEGAGAVYFPACISRTMGHLPGEPRSFSLPEALVALARRAGVPVHIPADARGVCCGVPFSSKGFAPAHRHAVNQAVERFWAWSREGALPVVVDTSPCTHGLRTCRPYLTEENQARFDRLTILDAVAFAHDYLLPRLTITRRLGPVVLHPVCSITKMELAPQLQALAAACAEQVVIPREAGCCGFAGDRGFLFPELTASATRREAAEVKGGAFAGHYSSSRTCEIGVSRATGSVYRSFLYLLEEATRG